MTGLQNTSYHYQYSAGVVRSRYSHSGKTKHSSLPQQQPCLFGIPRSTAATCEYHEKGDHHPDAERHHKRALKVAANVSGVESISVTGRDGNLLQVSGNGVDESSLIKKLRRVVGEAEIVDLRSLASGYLPGTSRDVVAAQSRSPHHWNTVDTPGLASYPVSAPSPLANPGAARWPAEQYRQTEAGYYPHAPSPSYYQASPLAGQGGYGGSGYARAAARSHPGNYSPMIERHDYLAAGSSHRHGDGRQPRCCSIQ